MDQFFEFVVNHWILASSFAVLLALFFLTESLKAGKSLGTQELVMLLNRDQAIVVDLRDKKEFGDGHITGALSIPFANLKDRAVELQKYKDKQIVLVDKMGQHTGMAGKVLRAAGYQNVRRLAGGVTEWRNANMPLVKK